VGNSGTEEHLKRTTNILNVKFTPEGKETDHSAMNYLSYPNEVDGPSV